MDYRKKFLVEPGSRVHLDEIDPSYTGKQDEASARAIVQDRVERLQRLQYLLYAENKRSVLIVLQAMDAAGKDGTIRHVLGVMNPQGAYVHPFKEPTPEEAAHDFLWRAHRVAPARAQVGIFNRSHYEDVLVARVRDLVPKDVWSKRYDRIVEFEKTLAQANTHIMKFYLHISADEQLRRFKARLEDPHRQWKISESDYADRAYWDDYMRAYEAALEKTSTDRAPWYVIPANHKWFRDLAVSKIVVDTLESLDMQYPPPSVDIEEIKRKYHAAKDDAEAQTPRD
ncbi:MAG: polyphosphate:nucleotide phosphotransferase, family [Candidatus Eremiobacteraeota bacterium]|nr:polyphosphate:nucleotide phosphotransferase, family [Candidatus Eremiobacteraeota bacterium]